MQTRLLTLAVIVLGAAAISVITVVKPAWSYLWAPWPLGSRLSTAPLIFTVQLWLLLSTNHNHSIYRLIRSVAIFGVCIALEGPLLTLIDPRDVAFGGSVRFFPGQALISFFVNWPSTALFAGMLLSVWTLNHPNVSNRRYVTAFSVALLGLVTFAFVYPTYRLVTPLQRVLILTAIEDVKLYDVNRRHQMHHSIGILPAGNETIVSYCYGERTRLVEVVPLPGNPETLAFTGREKTSLRTERTGLFSRPRILGCGDDWNQRDFFNPSVSASTPAQP